MLDPDIQGRLRELAPEQLMAVVDCLLGPQGGRIKNPNSSLLSVGMKKEKKETPGVDRGHD